MRQLFVVLGAGASHDCASGLVAVDKDMQPPLTKDLFSSQYREILNQYPLAQQMVPDLRPAIESGAIALESFLRDHWRDSEYPAHRRKYWAVPLYLQHLLWETGRRYIKDQPDNYDRLINETQRGFDHVAFLTLNYDTILDQRLELDEPIESMDDYVRPRRPWSLIKLHGSINWGHRIELPSDADDRLSVPPAMIGTREPDDKTFANSYASLGELGAYLSSAYLFMAGRSLTNFRRLTLSSNFMGTTGELVYPALAVPLGAEDTLNCPDEHIEVLRERMSDSVDGLNLLVIGYSGLDNEVLDQLAWSGWPVRTAKFVNGTAQLGLEAANRFAQKLRLAITEDTLFDGGFSKFAESGEMARFLRGLQ